MSARLKGSSRKVGSTLYRQTRVEGGKSRLADFVSSSASVNTSSSIMFSWDALTAESFPRDLDVGVDVDVDVDVEVEVEMEVGMEVKVEVEADDDDDDDDDDWLCTFTGEEYLRNTSP